MIGLDIEVPLPGFALRVEGQLGGAVTAVMGPSGSGKTTLLEAIAGLRPRASGTITLLGETLLDTGRGIRLPPERRRVGYVPQDAGLFPHLSVRGNLRFGARGRDRTLASAIETLGIGALLERDTREISGGEKQRVALARALATEPRLLLLDEPLAALDVGLRERVLPWLRRIRETWGIPILYVTHNAGEVLALAESVILLRRGRVEARGRPSELLSAPGFVEEASEGIENLLQAVVLRHEPDGGVTHVKTDGGVEMSIPLTRERLEGTPLTLAVRAEDVLVSTRPLEGISARNVIAAVIERIDASGPDRLLRCRPRGGGAAWFVRLTPSALLELGLATDGAVWLAVKSHSVRVVRNAGGSLSGR